MNLYPANPVLLVDDEEEILAGLKVTLALAGITNTLICSSGAAALDIARKQEIEAVLLDVLMPGLKGDEILEELLHAQPDLPVIMVTGQADRDSVLRTVATVPSSSPSRPPRNNSRRCSPGPAPSRTCSPTRTSRRSSPGWAACPACPRSTPNCSGACRIRTAP